jgi:hypothetical protein
MAVNVEISGIQPFDCNGDITSVSPRWKRRTSFRFFVEEERITGASQKKDLLLHCAGIADMQEIFKFKSEAGVGSKMDEYEVAIKQLGKYFWSKDNVPQERHVFRQIKQEDGETVNQFVNGLA